MKTNIIFAVVLLLSVAILCKSFYSFTTVSRGTIPAVNFTNQIVLKR